MYLHKLIDIHRDSNYLAINKHGFYFNLVLIYVGIMYYVIVETWPQKLNLKNM